MEWIGCGTRGNHHAEGKSRRDSRAGVTMLSRVPSFILLLCKSNKKREERGPDTRTLLGLSKSRAERRTLFIMSLPRSDKFLWIYGAGKPARYDANIIHRTRLLFGVISSRRCVLPRGGNNSANTRMEKSSKDADYARCRSQYRQVNSDWTWDDE